MFRFSIDKDSAERASEKQLISNDVGRDEDWEEGLRDTGEFDPAERCFRADTATPSSVDEAVSFVQGLFFTTPERVWIGDEVYRIDEETVQRAEKSTT